MWRVTEVLGSEFQNIRAATVKARRPYVVSRWDGITSWWRWYCYQDCLVVGVWMSLFVRLITLEPFEISSWNLYGSEQDNIKSSVEFGNSCILMHLEMRGALAWRPTSPFDHPRSFFCWPQLPVKFHLSLIHRFFAYLAWNAYLGPQNGGFGGLWTPKCDYSSSKPPKGTSLRKSASFKLSTVKIHWGVWPVAH